MQFCNDSFICSKQLQVTNKFDSSKIFYSFKAIKDRDSANKEKETMVIRYAVGEKNILKEKQMKEAVEKKFKDLQREYEILQHRIQTMVSEKARICQMLDNKCYEHKTVQQELERTKSDLTGLETKLKWSQNSLKNEIELHKVCKILRLICAKI